MQEATLSFYLIIVSRQQPEMYNNSWTCEKPALINIKWSMFHIIFKAEKMA